MIKGLDNDMELPAPDSATEDAIRAAATEELVARRSAAACSADGEAALGEAMQDIWNDRCVDCGEIPTCFEVHGPRTTRITADFEGSAFARDIVETLKSRGYSILPNVEVSDRPS